MVENKLAKQGVTNLSTIFGTEAITFDERPDFIPEGDKTGTEGITNDDIRLPRLGIAQGLSPQLTPGDNAYIDNLKMFQMFNDTTKEIYGNGPIYFVVVRRDVRCIEFRPRSEGGGVVDLNVPRNDPRATQWRDVDGVRVPPAATLFNEYVALILKQDGEVDPVVISIKGTNKFNRRATTDLNGFIKMYASQGAKSVPIYGVIYAIESRSEKNDNGTFGVPGFKPVGFIPKSMPGLFERAREYAATLEGKTVVYNREPGDEDDFIDPEIVS